MNDESSLAAALRALPQATPPDDGFMRLAARIRRRRHTRTGLRIALPAALAAGIAVALVLQHPGAQVATRKPAAVAQQAAPAPAKVTAELASLQASSRQWQAWVAKLDRDGQPLDGRGLAAATHLQDRIAMVDLQLSATRDPATSAELWQQRITLLQRLGLLHLQPYAVAQQTRTDSETTIM
ncbi:MAG TPA: hypothetical protein VFL63_05655 [Rhodanobacteraceae bacterium]|nr:hypothetical protein [Rhodanobacteraceae bacterium]